jgi:16S rRNA (cytidine1402-2'-O)-methyltransferase
MLYLVSTPIGNIADITLRAIDTLRSCDLILCEDTRRTSTLLHHYEIHTPLKSYEQFTEKTKAPWILQMLLEDKNIALVSDAGTPAVNDPGAFLVDLCHKNNILVESIPGASSVIVAYSLLGTIKPFQFLGFFPKKTGEQNEFLEKIQRYDGVCIMFESPHRIKQTLQLLPQNSTVTLFRELTKKFEEKIRGTPEEVLEAILSKDILGEIVLAIEMQAPTQQIDAAQHFAQALVKEHSLSINTAAKIAADVYNVKKQDVYTFLIEKKL